MMRGLNPLLSLLPWRRKDGQADRLYGAIVAQARLPAFYQEFRVPDTLEGRFAILSLHLFAVLHRLKGEGGRGLGLAQELIDRFSADMETVLREVGVGDLSIPKKVRRLASSSAALLQDYEAALAKGEDAMAASIAKSLPLEDGPADAVSRRLAPYLMGMVGSLEAQSYMALRSGRLEFPEVAQPLGEAGREIA